MNYFHLIAARCLLAVGLIFAAGAEAKITFVHTDHLGSVIAESNSSGVITKQFHYKPYGVSIEAQQDDMAYAGHKYDSDLALSYMGARYYEPAIGRFYSSDPVDYLGHLNRGNPVHGFNRYAYANNNPYMYVDPDGQLPIVPIAFAIMWVADKAYAGYEAHQDHKAIQAGEKTLAGVAVERGVEHAAGMAFGAIGRAGVKVTKAVTNRTASKIDDVTKPGSKLPNIKTDVPKSEFENNLVDNGFDKSTSKDGSVNIFTNGDKKYTTRDFSASTDGPTAEVFINNKPVSKIRLGDE